MRIPNPIGVISMFYARPFTREHFSAFSRMKAAGADVVELLVPEPGELDLAETRSAAEDAGLSIVLAARVNLTRDLASRESAAREAGVAYLETCVDTAAALGAKIVGGPLYGAPLVFAGRAPAPVESDERKRRVDAVVSGLVTAARRAADAGIVLGVEPLNRFETDIANTAGHAIEIAERVGSPAVGVMLDTFHMNMEEFDLVAGNPENWRPARPLPGQREQSRLRRIGAYRLARDRAGIERREIHGPDCAGTFPPRRREGRRNTGSVAQPHQE